MADNLVFSKMAPNELAQTTMSVMKNNYKKLDDISTDVKNHGIDEYLKYDNHGRFGFFKCEGCDGPMLGHQQTKCRHGDRYDD